VPITVLILLKGLVARCHFFILFLQIVTGTVFIIYLSADPKKKREFRK
jgi:hypothetical protein